MQSNLHKHQENLRTGWHPCFTLWLISQRSTLKGKSKAMCACVWVNLHFEFSLSTIRDISREGEEGVDGGCFASHRNRCSQAGRKLSDLYMDLIWQSQWGRRIPPWGWGAQTILEEAALTSNLRLPLFLIIRSLDFRNRIAHVVFVARKVSLLRNRAPFLVLIEGDSEWDGVVFMDKI